jgi:hypothetical protein
MVISFPTTWTLVRSGLQGEAQLDSSKVIVRRSLSVGCMGSTKIVPSAQAADADKPTRASARKIRTRRRPGKEEKW